MVDSMGERSHDTCAIGVRVDLDTAGAEGVEVSDPVLHNAIEEMTILGARNGTVSERRTG